MATATRILNAQQVWDTDAEFRADCLAIHNALIATGGLVQTADTGQTDFTANTRAGASYTVYRFNDVHQSSYPLFLRIDWGPNPTTTRPGFKDWTLGTGSNGSGTITGVIRAAIGMAGGTAGAGGAAGLCDNFVSVGEGYVYILMNIYAASPDQAATMMFIERSTDEAGVVHPEEGVVLYSYLSNSRLYAIHPFGFSAVATANSSPFETAMGWQAWDDLVSADIGLMPAAYMLRAKMRHHRFAFYRPGRISFGVPIDAAHLGGTKKLMPIEAWYYHGSNGWTWSTQSGPALALPWV